MKKHLYEIILPLYDNSNNSTHDAVFKWKRAAITRGGGLTWWYANGAWIALDGHDRLEENIVVQLACTEEDWADLVGLAARLFSDQTELFTAMVGVPCIAKVNGVINAHAHPRQRPEPQSKQKAFEPEVSSGQT